MKKLRIKRGLRAAEMGVSRYQLVFAVVSSVGEATRLKVPDLTVTIHISRFLVEVAFGNLT
jgi:hypothetical protein